MPMYEYQCSECEYVFEKLVSMSQRTETQTCPHCDELTADFIVSPTRCKLDGTDPGFPGAYDKWARDHEKAGRKTNF